MTFDIKYFECECNSPEHTIKFKFDTDDGELYTQIYLNQTKTWHKRVWIAIRYIFGYKSTYGAFDEFFMNKEDAHKFYNLAYQYRKFHNPSSYVGDINHHNDNGISEF